MLNRNKRRRPCLVVALALRREVFILRQWEDLLRVPCEYKFLFRGSPHSFLALCVSCRERTLKLSDAFIVSIKVIMWFPHSYHSVNVLPWIESNVFWHSSSLVNSVWSRYSMTIWKWIPLLVFTGNFCIYIRRGYWWVGVSFLSISLSGSDMRPILNSPNDLSSVLPSFSLRKMFIIL